MKAIVFKFKRLFYVVNRHILKSLLKGDFLKPLHFLKTIISNKIFGIPYLAMAETCNFCNLRCPTCTTPHSRINRPKEIMHFDNYKKIIDNASKNISVLLPWFSNEPMLNPDLPKMIEYADKKHIYTMISTNATLLTEKKGRELIEAGLDEILLCLDGIKKESYEPFREGADFNEVLKNIMNFCALRSEYGRKMPYLELQFILTKLNQDEVEDIQKLAKELKIDRLRIKSFALSEYAYSKDEIRNLTERFLPNKEKYSGKIRYKNEEGNLALKNKKEICGLVNSNIVILVDGRITICCYDLSGTYAYQGNLLNQKLKEIWKIPENKDKLDFARKRKFPLCKICAN